MVIFHSYVKLPEGSFLGKTKTCRSSSGTMAPPLSWPAVLPARCRALGRPPLAWPLEIPSGVVHVAGAGKSTLEMGVSIGKSPD